MNFKLNVKKVIASLIIGVIIGGLFMCRCAIGSFSDWVKYELPVYIGFIFGSIITYVIISLIEKDKFDNKIKSKKVRGKKKWNLML